MTVFLCKSNRGLHIYSHRVHPFPHPAVLWGGDLAVPPRRAAVPGCESRSLGGAGEGGPTGPCLPALGCGARARTASPRSDVAAAAGRITLLALCWCPLRPD